MKPVHTTSMLSLAATLLFTVTLVLGGQVQAEELDGALLFQTKTCFACHGVDAKTPILPIYPKLAGQNYDYMLNQIKDIKSGARNNGQTAAMQGVLHLVNEDEMVAIAKWIAALTW